MKKIDPDWNVNTRLKENESVSPKYELSTLDKMESYYQRRFVPILFGDHSLFAIKPLLDCIPEI